MSETGQKSIVYIDGANLHKGINALGWKLDYCRFYSWLRQKYHATEVWLFIGLIPKHGDLYTSLQRHGFKLYFKEVVYDSAGKAKGNCDADLVLKATRDVYELHPNRVVLVSSDGDYSSLVSFWIDQDIACHILSPAPTRKCSILLKKTGAPIVYLDEVKKKIWTTK